MTGPDPLLPKSTVRGLVPTLNNTGWMTEGLDAVSQAFVEYAGAADGECLDLGCAYGVATLPALAAGARVLACDMEPRHLEILAQRVPAADRARLRCQPGTMPEVSFPPGSFAAVLCARALHFLRGEGIEATVRGMHDWLKPGGRVFLVADSPYTGPWYTRAPQYEARKAAGDPWPGLVEDYRSLLPATSNPAGHPTFINPLDPDVLARVARAAGFEVLEARWLRGAMAGSPERTHAGLVARRPAIVPSSAITGEVPP
jgi:SAM-dependent methyltransferase